MKVFLEDLIKTFLYFTLSGVYSLLSTSLIVISKVLYFITTTSYSIASNVLADLNMISLIIKQSMYECTRDVSLICSKYLLKLAEYCSQESEKNINKIW